MNIEGLMRVQSAELDTEVTEGPKRGAKAVRDHAPLPSDGVQMKATLSIESSDSPGRPHKRRVFNVPAQKLVTTITTEQLVTCGIRLECYKGAESYPYEVLAKQRGSFYRDDFLEELRGVGFGLCDIARVIKINSQAAVVAFLEFELVYAEIQVEDSEGGWISSAQGGGTITSGPVTFSVTFKT